MKLKFDAVDRKLLDHLHKTALAFEELKELSVTSSCVMTVCTVTVSQVLLGWAEQHSPFSSSSSDLVSLVDEVVSMEPLVADRREQVHGLITSETPFAMRLPHRDCDGLVPRL